MSWLLWLHILLLFWVVWEARRCGEKGEWQGENIYFQKTHKCKSHAAAKPAGESAAGRQDVRSCVTGSSLSSFLRLIWFCVVQQDRHWGGTTSVVLKREGAAEDPGRGCFYIRLGLHQRSKVTLILLHLHSDDWTVTDLFICHHFCSVDKSSVLPSCFSYIVRINGL